MSLRLSLWVLLPLACLVPTCGCRGASMSPAAIALPPGFTIAVYAADVPGARSLTLGEKKTVFVGSRDEGKVYAIIDHNGDKVADETLVVAQGLRSPNGVAFRNGALYVAEIGRVLRFDRIEEQLHHPPPPVVVSNDFPRATHHGWKFIRFGPDGKLYVPVGAPCNNCEETDPRFATIMRMNPDGSALEIFAAGVRNTVGFDWHPETGELWFTDNGRDWLGDNQPPDELNRAPRPDLHFGFPYRYGRNLPDPEFGHKRSNATFEPPVQELGPHVAALGMRFYTGRRFPADYRNQIFIAEHGSWNRSERIGYRITLVRLDGNRAVSYTPFATGWLRQGKVRGRPVDVQELPDGSLLVSDDRAGVIYRIDYQPVAQQKSR